MDFRMVDVLKRPMLGCRPGARANAGRYMCICAFRIKKIGMNTHT